MRRRMSLAGPASGLDPAHAAAAAAGLPSECRQPDAALPRLQVPPQQEQRGERAVPRRGVP